LRIDVQLAEDGEEGIVRAWETYRGNDWGNKGEVVQVKEGSKGRGFELRAIGGKNYFMERPQCESHFANSVHRSALTYSSLGLCYPQEPHDSYGSRQSGSHGGHAEAHGQQYVIIHTRDKTCTNKIQWTLKCAPNSRPSERAAP
jgi:hypothetical protein